MIQDIKQIITHAGLLAAPLAAAFTAMAWAASQDDTAPRREQASIEQKMPDLRPFSAPKNAITVDFR